jgi:hypothetical protein
MDPGLRREGEDVPQRIIRKLLSNPDRCFLRGEGGTAIPIRWNEAVRDCFAARCALAMTA